MCRRTVESSVCVVNLVLGEADVACDGGEFEIGIEIF
jgi:hypothetical protein